MKKIPLRRINKETGHKEICTYSLVDDDDYPIVSKYNWSLDSNGYVGRRARGRYIKLHRFIAKIHRWNVGENVIDHINRDKKDNRKSNLRICTFQQNLFNRKQYFNDATSHYKGVSKRGNGHWRMRVYVDGKCYYDETYRTEIEAAVAYNRAAVKAHGEYAFLNGIPEEYLNIDVHPIVHNNKYRGVEKRPSGSFTATIKKNHKKYYLGSFGVEEDAAKAYDKKAIEFFGDKAVLNFPEAL